MVMKIFNWLGSGFFRSIGRVIAYSLIGLIIGYLAVKSDFKISDLFDFGLYVNASTTEQWSSKQGRVVMDDHGSTSFSSWKNLSASFDQSAIPYPVKAIQFKLNAVMSNENTYNFTLGFKATPDAIASTSTSFWKNSSSNAESNFQCSNWVLQTSGTLNTFYTSKCSFTPGTNYTTNDDLYIGIVTTQSYLTYLTLYVSDYEERLGTNAVITNSANSIINNNNSNTTSIINNNNQNTQSIINGVTNSATAITDTINQQIESQQVCNFVDKKNVVITGKYLYTNGSELTSADYGITEYFKINSSTKITVTTTRTGGSLCYYDINKTLISCTTNTSLTLNQELVIPSNSSYVRFTIALRENKPTFNMCSNGNQAMQDTLTDTDTESDSNDMADFLNDLTFEKDSTISSILLLPINFIEDIFEDDYTDDMCFTLKGVQSCIPNGKIIWNRSGCHENSFWGCSSSLLTAFKTFFNLVVGGFICYKLLIGVAKTYDRALDPLDNGLEVMKL